MAFWSNWFKPNEKITAGEVLKTESRVYHVYDDPYLEVERLENMPHCLEEMAVIAKFSEEHWTGAGWNDIYVRKKMPYPLEDLGVTLDAVRACVASQMPEYDQVVAHDSGVPEVVSNLYAFGHSSGESFFILVGPKGIVKAISCANPGNFLQLLPQRDSLLLLDWGSCVCVPLGDEAGVRHYMEEY